MKMGLTGLTLAAMMSSAAMAETIGVSMADFDDAFLTALRGKIELHAGELDGVEVQIENAQNDVGRQLSQIQNFAASGLDGIIVNPVDTDATQAMTQAAQNAGIPLVYVNREPVNRDELPANQAYVASDETQSGTLLATEVCRLLKEAGKGSGARIIVLVGELSNQAARTRTQDVHDVVATDDCSFMTIAEEQTANWSQDEAENLMTNWLASDVKFDAVLANNDAMALGAIKAMKAGGVEMDTVIVGGIDGTAEALTAMKAGELDVTVFQDANGQAKGAVDAALKLARGEAVEQTVHVPVEIVTPERVGDFEGRNGSVSSTDPSAG
ncbi:MAG: sugar ABC transporter substrate-binding protein [Fulvimarina manganoxydans]|uniref:sugar ABC transporter substrate-binding protein n=1 Tax=Fulvimarina manganoxydans TaxID=937218 RepID=UPI002354317D|nr:sugar ABC transporter substrate-binding protein [Fulvimarina manganoxydans]MCK5932089.1 sugar ABC transporter substrate-binding protein [Fulvimarina manganoxydans]